MKASAFVRRWGWFYLLTAAVTLCSALWFSRAVTASVIQKENARRATVIIDPGHGGMDGGAVSCTGVLESKINLEVAQRVHDLLALLGEQSVMIRTADVSVDTEGDTIARRKVSDLKNRVKLVQQTENPVLLSIHQNQFSDSRYAGAQVFYGRHSEALAKAMQSTLVEALNPGSRRKCKQADGIYLLQQVDCPAILVECGFLSNPQEEEKLRSSAYQKALACVIATVTTRYLEEQGVD